MRTTFRSSSSGQTIVMFALSLIVLILGVGLVVDGGFAFGERRTSQNASDFAALAGTRLVAAKLLGDTGNGTDSNVRDAIAAAAASNHASVTFGSPSGPRYVGSDGATLGFVGGGSIPACSGGVRVNASTTWRPFFLGAIGVSSWTASSTATARVDGDACPGVLPIGVSVNSVQGPNALPICQGPASGCSTQNLTSGSLNIPGGFGWLKFGCSGYGLGQVSPANAGGCQNNDPFLDVEVGPPSQSYGCCTDVGLAGSLDQIGSLPGNKPADLSYYVQNHIEVWVPVWDNAGGNGSNGYYHIVGYAAFEITGQDTQHGRWITGVYRSGMITTSPNLVSLGVSGDVQLIR